MTVSVMAQNDTDPVLENKTDSVSYFLGLTLGYSFHDLPFETNMDLVLKGIEGAMKNTSGYDLQQTEGIFRQLQQTIQENEKIKEEAAALTQQEESLRFLEENGKKEGVFTTTSGLQYEILEKSEGPMPADTSQVEVHYHGTLVDGTVFDSSFDRGESVTFGLNQVIRGWTEGVQLMPVGSTYRFYIPPQLGYGGQATGSIPANSVLIFKVELIDIK